MYFYFGVALRKLLLSSPKIIRGVILATMGFQVMIFLLNLLRGELGIVRLIIVLLILWYILNNVKRLSSEEQSKLDA